jgi:hypothetical protein
MAGRRASWRNSNRLNNGKPATLCCGARHRYKCACIRARRGSSGTRPLLLGELAERAGNLAALLAATQQLAQERRERIRLLETEIARLRAKYIPDEVREAGLVNEGKGDA